MKRLLWWMALAGLGLLGCERAEPPASPAPAPAPEASVLSAVDTSASLAALNRGAQLYQEHCAQCHGPEAQGHPDWQTPGVVAAPPLNGTGNDVKRSRAELVAVILSGASRKGAAVMPGWKGRLSEEEIGDIVAWFQALWPVEAYAAWQARNASGR